MSGTKGNDVDPHRRGNALHIDAREWYEFAKELRSQLRDGQKHHSKDALLFNQPLTLMDSVITLLGAMQKERA